MFKQSSFEKEIFESMKSNLKSSSQKNELEKKSVEIKIAQNLNIIKDLLKDNKFEKQASVIEKYINKKASKVSVINSFNKEFKDNLNSKLEEKLLYHFAKADFSKEAVDKMIKKEAVNKFDELFSKHASRSVVSFSGNLGTDIFNKNVFKNNQVLEKISKLIDPLEQEINNETVIDENLSDDDFED